jgi:hypothetical protein
MKARTRGSLAELLVRLRLLRRKVGLMSQRVGERIATLPRDSPNGVYGREVEQLSKLFRWLVRLEVGLELLEVRVETAFVLGNAVQSISEVVRLVREAGAQLSALPDISMGLQEIEESLSSVVREGETMARGDVPAVVEEAVEERLRSYLSQSQ